MSSKKLNKNCNLKAETKDVKVKIDNNYSSKYRIIKTLLMTAAWVSLGINIEISKTSLEDLKILLNINYQSVSFGLVIRSIGYMTNSALAGLIADRFIHYSDLLMAFGKLLIILRKIFMHPFTQIHYSLF